MNNTPRTTSVHSARKSRLAPFLLCLATILGLPVHAAVSLPDTPMQTNNGVPPNLLFILDDSGSMGDNFMPDSIPATTPNPNISRSTYTLNTIYYNPATSYRTWQQADGSFMAAVPYTAAYDNTALASNPIDLGNATDRDFYTPIVGITNITDTRQYVRHRFHRNGATISGGGALIVSSCAWNPLANNFADPTPAVTLCARNFANFTWPGGIVRSVAQEKQNFATWYAFGRTRMKVAKTSASIAFNDTSIFNADNEFRVGYKTIHNRSNFLIPVGTNNGVFTGANRTTWFARLFAAIASGNTPTNRALYDAGEYFKQTGTTGPWGPQPTTSQYECRQNFSILTTDGYRNESGLPVVGNVDNTAGPVITRPSGPSYQYTPVLPHRDNWSDTLSDIAMSYWVRDLRSDLDNIVPSSAANPAFWQHMVTFGISIGLKGSLDPVADLPALTSGAKTWPQPVNLTLSTIDDMFHATLNGRGTFVAAGDPDEFSEGLGNALRAIAARRGSGSNAAVTGSSTSSGNKLFQAKFFSAQWSGEVQAFNITSSGVDTTAPVWTASIPAYTSRIIRTHNGSAGTVFPTVAQTLALTPDVANYIRGDRSRELPAALGIFRNRTSLLGTVVNSSPVYVKTDTAVETVYVGANDGMLHAFDAANGVERFAYVPSGIDLTDLKEYSNPTYGHRFFVDGAIITSTKRELASRTVLVGALGRGGRGLFALDVTDPTSFTNSNVLWDKNASFDTEMGQVLGKPVIAKLNDGTTAVLVPNGLNSTTERAVLFVLDLQTGAKIAEIDTGVGSPTVSNGLSSPRGWDEDGNGTVDIVYAGDFRGNLWKFDLSGTNPSMWNVANGRALYTPPTAGAQPVTGGVTIAVDPATDKRWVFFGTGRLLTTTDLTDTALQAWHGVIDDPAATSSVTRASMTARNIAYFDVATKGRAFEPNSALPAGSKGWYINLDQPPSNTLEGERMVGDQQVIKNVLLASSIIPSTENPCRGGRGYVNALDAFTGTSLASGFFGSYDGNGVFVPTTVGPGTPLGSVNHNVGLITESVIVGNQYFVNGNDDLAKGNVDEKLIGGRISWREIIQR
ncbi:MAG: PilC/PilY family type IV pilus protein [Pseudomonadota bacterium]